MQRLTRSSLGAVLRANARMRTAMVHRAIPSFGARSFASAAPVAGSADNAIPAATDGVATDAASTASEALIAASEAEIEAASQVLDRGWGIIFGLQDFVEWIHVASGLPYWATIGVATVGVRSLLFPVFVSMQKNAGNLALAQPEMNKLMAQMKVKKDAGTFTKEDQIEHAKELQFVMHKYKANPFKAILPALFQMPLFISMFMSLRQMPDRYPGLAEGGFSWVTDLSVPDPYWILPMASSGLMLINIRSGADNPNPSDNNTMMKNVMTGLAVITVPVVAQMPAALGCYFVSTNIISLVQAKVVRAPILRRALGLMPLETLEAVKAEAAAAKAKTDAEGFTFQRNSLAKNKPSKVKSRPDAGVFGSTQKATGKRKGGGRHGRKR